jgi:hypothetical protein
MSIYRGTYYALVCTVKDSDGVAIDITDWEFSADVREDLDDDDPLFSLTTANGGFAVTSAGSGIFEIRITDVNTALCPLGKVVLDVLRTDIDPGPRWLFGARIKVKEPVTRD